MGLFGKSYEQKIAEIQSMVREAVHDGIVTEDEVNWILNKARKFKVVDEAEQMLDNAIKQMEKKNIQKLENFIKQKITNGELTSAEKDAIYQKAEGLYIDEHDCDILIDKMTKGHIKNEKFKKVKTIAILSVIGLVAIMILFPIVMKKIKYKFDTVEEALANYDFIEARSLAADLDDDSYYSRSEKAKTMYKIINMEADYCIENKAYEKAIQVANEIHPLINSYEHFWGDKPDTDKIYDEIVLKILLSLSKSGRNDIVNKYAQYLKDNKTLYNFYIDNKQFDDAITLLGSFTMYNTFSQTKDAGYGGAKEQERYNDEVSEYNDLLNNLVTKLAINKDKTKAISLLNAYAKGHAKYIYTKNNLTYFKLDYTWRNNRIKEIKAL